MTDRFSGLRVIESVYAVKDGDPVVVPRRWRERWLTRPWRPWISTRLVVPKVPAWFLIDPTTVVMHPACVVAVRDAAQTQGEGT